MMKNEEIVDWTLQIAHEAGKILLTYFGTGLTKHIKTSETDYATEADMAAESVIVQTIKQSFPQDSIFAEESGYFDVPNAEYRWFIDPLDGTHNFAEQRDDFGVMIVRTHIQRGVELAVVYEPKKNRHATAIAGQGVLLNGQPVQRDNSITLQQSTPLIGALDRYPYIDRVENVRQHLLSLHIDTSSYGSAITNAMQILAGERDGYIGNYFHPWDVLPLDLLLREAGLTVTNFQHTPLFWDGRGQSLIAAPPAVHAELLELLHTL